MEYRNPAGYGPSGRSYPYAVTLEAVVPVPEGLDVQLIFDDGGVTRHVRYWTDEIRERETKLEVFDSLNNLYYLSAVVPPSTENLFLECFDRNYERVTSLCCIFDVKRRIFKPMPATMYSSDCYSSVNNDVPSLGSSGVMYEDDWQRIEKAIEEEDTSFTAIMLGFVGYVILLSVRCYVGAMIMYNLGYDSYEAYFAGAFLLGVISERTMGDTLATLVKSSLIKAGLIFAPVLVVAYFTMRPDILSEIVYNPGDFIHSTFGWIQFWSPDILQPMWHAIAALSIVALLGGLISGLKEQRRKRPLEY